MTELQYTILEASNDDLITSYEAASMFNMVTEGYMPLNQYDIKNMHDGYRKVAESDIKDVLSVRTDLAKRYECEIDGYSKYPDWECDAEIQPANKAEEPAALSAIKKDLTSISNDITRQCEMFLRRNRGIKDTITAYTQVDTGLFGNKHRISTGTTRDVGGERIPLGGEMAEWLEILDELYSRYSSAVWEPDRKYADMAYYKAVMNLIKSSKIEDKFRYAYMLPFNGNLK